MCRANFSLIQALLPKSRSVPLRKPTSKAIDNVFEIGREELAQLLNLDRAAFCWYAPDSGKLDIAYEYNHTDERSGLGQWHAIADKAIAPRLNRSATLRFAACDNPDVEIELRSCCYRAFPMRSPTGMRTFSPEKFTD